MSNHARRPSRFPGERLGLPRDGYRSVARLGRRIIALVVDWTIAYIIALFIWGYGALTRDVWGSFLILAVFVVLQIVAIITLGGSLAHRMFGMAVTPLRGGWVGLWRPVVRSVLLATVIPALVWDSDQRGFHDIIAGTVLVRTTRTS